MNHILVKERNDSIIDFTVYSNGEIPKLVKPRAQKRCIDKILKSNEKGTYQVDQEEDESDMLDDPFDGKFDYLFKDTLDSKDSDFKFDFNDLNIK